MKTLILAGGLGTRLQEETTIKPKPMVEIGHRPILWHIMKIYSTAGFRDFIICLGYKGEMIKDYFLNYYFLHNSLTVSLRDGSVFVHGGECEDWQVTLVDTGLHTQTGGRIRRVREFLGNSTFMVTYGDGVADIDLLNLLAFHRRHGRLATVTAVRPPARFGALQVSEDRVDLFSEKPQAGEGWINGGFFVFEPELLDFIPDDDSVLERGPLESLARAGQLMAYRHEGFWHCMDTVRDVMALNQMWASGKAPWKVWEKRAGKRILAR